ncbi:hypothetical protein, partial [Klebsiella pneumoniae]|uniref:hypothetical protein n=1 Tax=Klebsiella pneumoniae TaxID=573 RepID=UPI003EBB6118
TKFAKTADLVNRLCRHFFFFGYDSVLFFFNMRIQLKGKQKGQTKKPATRCSLQPEWSKGRSISVAEVS